MALHTEPPFGLEIGAGVQGMVGSHLEEGLESPWEEVSKNKNKTSWRRGWGKGRMRRRRQGDRLHRPSAAGTCNSLGSFQLRCLSFAVGAATDGSWSPAPAQPSGDTWDRAGWNPAWDRQTEVASVPRTGPARAPPLKHPQGSGTFSNCLLRLKASLELPRGRKICLEKLGCFTP